MVRQVMEEETARVIDGFSILTLVGSMAGVLPHVASILTIIWVLIRIYETETVQKWLGRRRGK